MVCFCFGAASFCLIVLGFDTGFGVVFGFDVVLTVLVFGSGFYYSLASCFWTALVAYFWSQNLWRQHLGSRALHPNVYVTLTAFLGVVFAFDELEPVDFDPEVLDPDVTDFAELELEDLDELELELELELDDFDELELDLELELDDLAALDAFFSLAAIDFLAASIFY